MQARRSKTFAESHMALLALTIALLALAIALILAGTLSSDQKPVPEQVVQPAVSVPAFVPSSAIGFDPGASTSVRHSNLTRQLQGGLGVGFDPGFVSVKPVPRTWGLGVGFDAGAANATAPHHKVRQLPNLSVGPTEH